MSIQVDLKLHKKPHGRPACDLVNILKDFQDNNHITISFYNKEGAVVGLDDFVCAYTREQLDRQEYVFSSPLFWSVLLQCVYEEENTQAEGIRLTITGKDAPEIKEKLERFYLFNANTPEVYGTERKAATRVIAEDITRHRSDMEERRRLRELREESSK